MKLRVTWNGKTTRGDTAALTGIYDVDDGFDGQLQAVEKFRAEFKALIPPYKPGTSFSAWGRRFSAERVREARPDGYWKRARCGDEVFDEADPRHVGKIEIVHNRQVTNCSSATVRWTETGWKSAVPLRDLRAA